MISPDLLFDKLFVAFLHVLVLIKRQGPRDSVGPTNMVVFLVIVVNGGALQWFIVLGFMPGPGNISDRCMHAITIGKSLVVGENSVFNG